VIGPHAALHLSCNNAGFRAMLTTGKGTLLSRTCCATMWQVMVA